MADDLDDALASQFEAPPLGSEDAERWRIETDRQASWAARKIRQARREIARLTEQADEERAVIEEWLNDRTYGLRQTVEFFEQNLVGYYRALHDADPDLPKTYHVLGADLKRRKNPDRVEVTNETLFLAWALSNMPEAVSMKPDKRELKDRAAPVGLDRAELGEHLSMATKHGEIVPGVEWVVGDERYEASVEP